MCLRVSQHLIKIHQKHLSAGYVSIYDVTDFNLFWRAEQECDGPRPQCPNNRPKDSLFPKWEFSRSKFKSMKWKDYLDYISGRQEQENNARQ